jgi:hypothetical protein
MSWADQRAAKPVIFCGAHWQQGESWLYRKMKAEELVKGGN